MRSIWFRFYLPTIDCDGANQGAVAMPLLRRGRRAKKTDSTLTFGV